MPLNIRPVSDHDVEPLVQMAWLAFEPIFRSFRQIMGDDVFTVVYPDWKKTQQETVEGFCKQTEGRTSYVAELDGVVAGFIVLAVKGAEKIGEVEFLMVHPDDQNRGVGAELNRFALQKLKEAGMEVAVVGTGGDPGHAAARRSYEKAGYKAFPQVWYYQKL
jgi:ribosomal protein S18 acetylase RimI-like enzyme